MKDLSRKTFERAKVAPTQFDRALEIVVAVLTFMTILMAVFFYTRLPEQIPIHFDWKFVPNGYGSKENILFLQGLMLLVVLVMWLGTMFPGMVNLPVKRNPEKEVEQQALLCRSYRVIALWVVVIFLFITLAMVSPLWNFSATVWGFPILLSVIGMIGTIIFYSIKINRV